MRNARFGFSVGVFFVCCLQLMYAAESTLKPTPPWKFTMNQGKSSVTFGFLAQPQFESLENASGNGSLENLFFRRLRFISGGKITPKLSFFVESDAANLGKQSTADGPRMHDFFLQDAYLSYAFRTEFQLDAGQLLMPVSHNSQQSAASLLPVDYGPYSFLATDSHADLPRAGRDYGLQARGYIKKHYEYRMGLFRGSRNSIYWNNPIHDGDFPLRYLARFVWYPLEADTGFFYTGTTHGQKKILGIGFSVDHQGDYTSNAVDVFFDHPLPNGDSVTAQFDFIHYDGGTLYASLHQPNTFTLEGSYYNKKTRLGPFMQFGSRDYAAAKSDKKRVQGGIAYWILKHRLNIKAGLGRWMYDDASDRTQIVIQTQFFYY
jgi:hypothetical protein